MLTQWEYESFASDKQCIERALIMWKKWMSTKKTYTDEIAIEGTMYVINHMKLRDHLISLIHNFFDEFLNLLNDGEELAETFYQTIMKM
ncbi:hypothetical protein ER45_028870 (plasmid) [Bacillus mycoides]|nr:hypothetical protein ER45_028870 [Bacillus mycoides]